MDKLENNYSWIFIKIDVIIEAYGYIYIYQVLFSKRCNLHGEVQELSIL